MKHLLFSLVVFAVLATPILAVRYQYWDHADCTGAPQEEAVISDNNQFCQPADGTIVSGGGFFRLTSSCSRKHDITYDTYSDGLCTERTGSGTIDRFPAWGCYNDRSRGSGGFRTTSFKMMCGSASTTTISLAVIALFLASLLL